MLCTLDRTIFENRDTGFCIASFKTKDEAVPSAARNPYSHGDKLIRFTAVGYEIPFTRTFYEYKQIEPADTIAKRIEIHEQSLMKKLHGLFGEAGE